MIPKLAALALLIPGVSSAACIPFDQAQKHIGETQCVSGKVLRVPPLPKMFDVEQKGHFSAGQSHAPHKRSTRKKKQPATLLIEVSEDAEQD